MRIAIATTSLEKIAGIKEAVCRFFNLKETEAEFYSMRTNSGVAEQPFGDDTYQGALSRVNAIKKEFQEMDLYISCEAGIEKAFGQYFNVQVICIFENKETYLWGKSSGWSIPPEDIEVIKESNLDKYLREKGINSIEELLGTSYSRRSAVAQATELALASRKLK